MRVHPSWSIALIAASALATGACKGDAGPVGPVGPTGPPSPGLVSWVSPANGDGSVSLDAVVRASFTRDVDATTLTAANFQLSAGGTAVAATISYNPGSHTAFLAPSSPLASFAYYTATLGTGVKDTGGNPLPASYTWSFWSGGSFSHSTLYVGCFNTTVQVFNAPAFAGGAQVPDRSITITGLGNATGLWLDTATDRLYIVDYTGSQIFVVDSASTANGTVAAARTIVGAATGLLTPTGAWLDPVNDRLYVANFGGNGILVYNNASAATGNVAPARTIAGATTGMVNPVFLPWLDVLADQLYVSNYGGSSITAFTTASTANGNVAPARTISGALTTLLNPGTPWLDKAADRLYVANAAAGTVLVFNNASTATGNIAPSRTISTGGRPYGLWLDAATDRLFVGDASGHRVLVFNGASGLTGTPTPTQAVATCGVSYNAVLMFDPGN